MNFCYLISSNVRYAEPLKRLLKSMEYIPPSRKFIVVGGHDKWEIGNNFPLYVPHNSFDYTALIEFVGSCISRPAETHVFLLHDTMELTPESDALIGAADPIMDATAAYPGGQSNLCLFRMDYLMTQRDKMLALRNCTKIAAHDFERTLFNEAPRQALYPNATIDVLGEERVYGGLPRRIERYNAIKALKFKASFGQDMDRIGERVIP